MTPDTHQRRTALILSGSLGAMLAAIAGYLSYIEIASSTRLSELASDQQHMQVPLRAERGNLLDARLRVLATSIEAQSVFADPKIISDPTDVATKIARALGVNADTVLRKIEEERSKDPPGRFVWLARRVTPEAADQVRQLGLPGIGLTTEGTRHYPNGQLASHLVGYVGIDEQGLEGIERLFNKRLAGRSGKASVLADRSRRPIWTEPDRYEPAEDGQHLVLTIDATIQAIAEAAIAEARNKHNAQSATAIVMDPTNGAILAMANVPTYDPNHYADSTPDSRRNRAVTDTFPPGSSCKPFFACSALDNGIVHFGETIYCENGYWAAARLHDAGHSYGNLTFEQVLEKSSNIGMAKIGVRMGDEIQYKTLKGFGFGMKTGVWLPGESNGVVFSLPRWTKLSTTRVPIGQEFATTPLQLMTGFAAIANHGKLLRPKILRGVLDHRGQAVVDLSEAEVVGQAVTEKTARQLIDRALVGVVEEGTGTACKIPGYKVFGKTGTAQKIDPETKTISHTRYVGTFMAGAPAQNPQVVVLVMVNEPRTGGYYGGTVAAPAVKKILEQTLPYLGIAPTEPVALKNGTHLVMQDVRVTD